MKRFSVLLLGVFLLGCAPLGLFQAEPTLKPTRTPRATATYAPPTETPTPWIITREVTREITRVFVRVITATPAPTFTPTVAPTRYANFRADQAYISAGSCTLLRWDVEGVREVYLDGVGVLGHDSKEVCPNQTSTYSLRVVLNNGQVNSVVTVTVIR